MKESNARDFVVVTEVADNIVGKLAKTSYGAVKTGARINAKVVKAYAKQIKRIHNAKKEMSVLVAATSVEIIVPKEVVRGPQVKGTVKAPNVSESKVPSTVEKQQGDIRGTSPRVNREVVKLNNPTLRRVAEYDIESIAEKNGIKSGQTLYVSSKNSIEELEEKNKVHSKEKTGEEQKVPQERKTPQGEEKTEQLAKKNKIRSKEHKDNLKKKEKKSRKKKSGKKKSGSFSGTSAAMKREMKYFVAKQIFQEGEDSGIGEAALGVGRAAATEILKKVGKGIVKVTRKALWKLLIIAGTALGHMIVGLAILLFPILFPLLVILFCIVAIVVLASSVIGLFIGTDHVSQEDFVVALIENHKAAIVREAENYEGTKYKGILVEEVELNFVAITDIDANSDDMLLIYMTEATDEGKFSEDSNQAPLLNVNTRTEKKVMEKVLKEMLYISSVTYEKKTRETKVYPTVTAAPQETLSPAPIPDLGNVTPTVIPTPTPAPNVTSTPVPTSTPIPEATITMTPTPMPEPEYIIVEEPYYIAHVTIYGVCADTWEKEKISKKEETVYTFLYEMFRSFGYRPGGGDTVCSKYSDAQLE